MGLFKSREEKMLEKLEKQQKENEKNGNQFEEKTRKSLSSAFNVPVAANILIDNAVGNIKTELDGAFVTKKGIFCLECKFHKNVSFVKGDLIGDWQTDNFQTVENPIHQNDLHVRALRQYIDESVPIINLIAMNSDIEFFYFGKQYNGHAFFVRNKNTALLSMASGRGVKELKKLIEDQMPDILNEDHIKQVTDFLMEHQATPEQRLEHKKEMIRIKNL